jgi:hypothetical protein
MIAFICIWCLIQQLYCGSALFHHQQQQQQQPVANSLSDLRSLPQCSTPAPVIRCFTSRHMFRVCCNSQPALLLAVL